MLVSVALLVLMMTVIVQVFKAATDAVSASRTYQELDGALRNLDATLRNDLSNTTVRMTPPRDPKNNEGYLEYIENSFADSQGEDADDCLRMTVKAPEGQLFSGRIFLQTPSGNLSQQQLNYYLKVQPITVQSQFAEVIYFLRNGNLYRRVLLVAPQYQTLIPYNSQFAGVFGGIAVSFQGVNDVSAHINSLNSQVASPSYGGQGIPSPGSTIVQLNTLGDLTNRQYRYASPQFPNDLDTNGVPDDNNSDTVDDYYPSLSPSAVNAGTLVNEPNPVNNRLLTVQAMPFPFIYPYAYTHPDNTVTASLAGWIHSPDPGRTQGTIAGLNAMNHQPLDVGDSLPIPTTNQTYWGFPTWRETMSPYWTFSASPVSQFGYAQQPPGLEPYAPNATPNTNYFLPPMTSTTFGSGTPFRIIPQPFNDGVGSTLFAAIASPPNPSADYLWAQCWEDDLVMVGVRSFDVKAYDDAFPGYVDLGWADDGRLWAPYMNANQISNWTAPYLLGAPAPATQNNAAQPFYWPPNQTSSGYSTSGIYGTFAHEGRMPPLLADYRFDYNTGATNLGDDTNNNNATPNQTIRLRRTWDTWSTDYTNAPSTGVYTGTGISSPPLATGATIGSDSPFYSQPILPSYPPPYPQPMRGLQIQLRVTDPRNLRIKTLTIRQDFSDKL